MFYTTADGTPVENEREKTLLMSTSDGTQLRKMSFQVATVNKALGSGLEEGEERKQSCVRHVKVILEMKMRRDVLWLRERDGVFVVDMKVAQPGSEQNCRSTFGRHVTRACKSNCTNRRTWNVG